MHSLHIVKHRGFGVFCTKTELAILNKNNCVVYRSTPMLPIFKLRKNMSECFVGVVSCRVLSK